MESRSTFQKELEALRELYIKGSEADPKKFHILANSMIWDLQANFCLPLTAEQLEFIKILNIAEAGGEYWKGVGWALTAFLVPLGKSLVSGSQVRPGEPVTANINQLSSTAAVEEAQPALKASAQGEPENPKPPEQKKGDFILD